jgi:hypothetical protein
MTSTQISWAVCSAYRHASCRRLSVVNRHLQCPCVLERTPLYIRQRGFTERIRRKQRQDRQHIFRAPARKNQMFSSSTHIVSANRDRNGIVWIVETRAWNEGGTREILRAYAALNVARQLYSSDHNQTRDQAPGQSALLFRRSLTGELTSVE